ncbi:myotubularin-related protein 10 isoform X4 [Bubalus bubalis]|uniref:myotubularin-related protein 10 isoform X4 n=1 Tax=Bubalus bubalis TaxID=89462 RepID=UPI000DBCB2E4|nr:myotubularin-related protein 10 isoform X4 [Bubalus bubalis]
MFSLKPPRPTFRSYLLPPPQTDDKINSEPKIKKLEPVLLPASCPWCAGKCLRPRILPHGWQHSCLPPQGKPRRTVSGKPWRFSGALKLLLRIQMSSARLASSTTVVVCPVPQAHHLFLSMIIPALLPRILKSSGEIVVNEVNFVRKCIASDTSQYDLWGKLICSNFKISFITDDPMPLQKFHYRNLLLGEHDVPLTCIEQIVTLNDHKRKQKVLGPNQKLKFNPTELIIYCKDFRIVRFRFDESGPESAKKVCLAIAHYSQPTDLQLLFAFEYVGKKYHNSAGKANGAPLGAGGGSSQKTPLFETYSDWDREVKRTGASGWRVCSINEGYMISTCLPEYFVVPSSLADQDLKVFSHSFVGRRMPFWCWSHSNGSALVRTALIRDVLQQRKIEQRICNAITKSHPQRSDVYKSDLDKTLPNIQDIQVAFVKLKQLCVNEPFEETEEKWLSSLENTRWLEYVRAFLKHAAELVYVLESKRLSVVLQEEEGRDLSCIIASLVQVMLDPYFRTITGFQSLIQKEWVMAGYPFLDRCNHLKRSEKEAPVFLLFLDTTWQLLEQCPAAFEFSETYLAVLHDSTRVALFGTFLFNSPHQRVQQSTEFAISKNIQLGDEKGLKFPSVWDWSLQFTPKDCTLFHNPFYIGKSTPCVQNGSVKSFKRTKGKLQENNARISLYRKATAPH